METPKSRKRVKGSTTPRNSPNSLNHSTPKLQNRRMHTSRINGLLVEFSPNSFCSTQEVLEVGWGDDSPVHPRADIKYPSYYDRPTSPVPNQLSNAFTIPRRPSPDVAKYLLDIQKMSQIVQNAVSGAATCNKIDEDCSGVTRKKLIESEPEEPNKDQNYPRTEVGNIDSFLKDDDSLNECLVNCTQTIECQTKQKLSSVVSNLTNNPQKAVRRSVCMDNNSSNLVFRNNPTGATTQSNNHKPINSIDSGVTSDSMDDPFFKDEDDVWLSQVVVDETHETPKKTKLVKCRSDDNLGASVERRKSFRKTSSFNNSSNTCLNSNNLIDSIIPSGSNPRPIKRQKSEIVFKCTPQEIERKRLEALIRKNKLEAERKKENSRLKYNCLKNKSIKS